MSNNRRRGREYALKILFALKYQSDQVNVDQILENFWDNLHYSEDILGEPLEDGAQPVPEAVRLFTEKLVRGVLEQRPLLDERIKAVAHNWSLTRMATVDLALLRLATYELQFLTDIPTAVTLNEAIEIAKRYGSKESPPFINGLLDKIAQKNSARQKAD
ncbi:transcription antitermination factor NusB [Pelovirga terrestris]|uniref:Transcription antitermination protein NusB n=1 Tax=Pelovirga terrestris TaxID=2771352 RepID=A0A8J6R4U7_9BACT|nr:transcription antitermination factor NusB [Pelovirga terrestris]MBD1399609.1 transcription antitermination factor NusB [Pelovirga terrestris]